MLQSSIFRWRAGAGWLVLSGGGKTYRENTEAIDTRMLSRSAADGPLVYINAANPNADEAEAYLSYLTDLGGRSGYVIDVISEDDLTLQKQLGEAGIIVIGNGPDSERLINGLRGAAITGIELAYQQGALVMGIGAGAEVFGQWILGRTPAPPSWQDGFGWVGQAAILAGMPTDVQKSSLQQLLQTVPDAFGLTVWAGSALVLGPERQIELWGNQQISITLGSAYSVQG